MSRRILITGGQGFLGRYLAAHCLQVDPTCLVLSIGRSPEVPGFARSLSWGREDVAAPLPLQLAQWLPNARHRYESIDVSESLAMTELMSRLKPTHIVHLAGQLRDDSLEHLLKSNILAVETLLESLCAADVQPEKVVLGSTGGVYGAPDHLPISEGHPCEPLNLYTSTKLAAEHISRSLAKRHGLAVVWARIFNPVGAGQDERHLTSQLAMQVGSLSVGEGEKYIEVGPLNTTRDFIDAEDVACALWCLATKSESGKAYNVGSGIETPISDTLKYCLKAAGVGTDIRIERRPARPSDVPRHVADISLIKALGFEAKVDFETSIARLIHFYKHQVRDAANHPPELSQHGSSVEVRIPRVDHYAVTVEKGVLRRLPQLLRGQFPEASFAVLTDERVFRLYGEQLTRALDDEGLKATTIVVPEGEGSKSPQQQNAVFASLKEGGFNRRSVLINVGGGMICDLGGYVAATYLRGINYVNVPTTLLAQHDAAIGGKVAVNAPWAKNFMGAFHHPRAVYIDPSVLFTLDARDIGAGVSEALKVALCGERSLFLLLEKSVQAVKEERDPELLGQIVSRAVRHKLKLLEPDPYEIDLRRVLNLGHSFGHALETHLHYTDLRHGEAVAWGTVLATVIACRRGECSREDRDRILKVFTAYGLPPKIEIYQLRQALSHLDGIRLVRGGALNVVLPTGIDSVHILRDIEDREFLEAIEQVSHLAGVQPGKAV